MSRSRGQAPGPPASLEDAADEAFPYLLDGLGVAALGLLVPVSLRIGLRFGGQLILLVIFGLLLAARLLPLIDTPWFGNRGLSATRRVMATGLGAVIIVTGVVGLVTLASSAALRFQPSTQFLQLLSALDIAWAASTVMVALYWLRGRTAAIVGGALVGVLCIATIFRYLDAVGFTKRGRWLLNGGELWTYVIPYDLAVAIIAIGLFVYAARRRALSI
jgi:hypothetical protein